MMEIFRELTSITFLQSVCQIGKLRKKLFPKLFTSETSYHFLATTLNIVKIESTEYG